ncbi:hypothetical protein AUC61_23995 [Pseudomonas sp. S25]|uniref:Uncharacterized protein n=1 Tax=Pseudomonas maioricensis TaxID=1766623 RepID=A0ABS9ZRS1_9PSED|nr:hypothetical protein [Pseudomonas sp. S25]MCI8212598.1 hypothetical protein [Pseudomonas sp. S25]
MKCERKNLTLRLWNDSYRTEAVPADHLIELARILDTEFSSAEVKLALSTTRLQPSSYVNLRRVLLTLRRSEVVTRRLTLWERITGRLAA